MVYSDSTTTPSTTSTSGGSSAGTGTTNDNSITATKDPNDSSKYTDVKDSNGEIIGNGNFQGQLGQNQDGGFTVNNFNGEMTTKDGTKVSGSADQVVVGKDGKTIVKGLKSSNKEGGSSSSSTGSLTTQDGTKISGSADTVTINKDKGTTVEGFKNGEMTLKDGTTIKGYADKIEIDGKGKTTITGFAGEYKTKDGVIVKGNTDKMEINGNSVAVDFRSFRGNKESSLGSSSDVTITTPKGTTSIVTVLNNGLKTTIEPNSEVKFDDYYDFLRIDAKKGTYTNHNNNDQITVSSNGKIEQVKTGSSNFIYSVDYYAKDKKLVQVRDGIIADPNKIVKDESGNNKKVEYWEKWSRGALISNKNGDIKVREGDRYVDLFK